MEEKESQLAEITRSLLEDYEKGRDIDCLDGACYPTRTEVAALIRQLRGILLPGFRGETAADTIRETLLRLQGQMDAVMGADADTMELCLAFFRQLPEIRAMLQTDLQAAFDGDPAASGKAEIIFSYPGLFAITVYRLAHVLHQLGVPMIPRIMTEHAHSVTGIDIHPGASIGDYFFIDHGTGIVIGETTVIGRRVKIYQGVTLGGLSTRGGQSLRGTKRHPTIGDDVTIYANAAILGGNTVIGHNCVIGASAFITESVPPCTTVSMKDRPMEYRPRNCPGCERNQ